MRIYAGLPQGVQFQPTLDPREAVTERRRDIAKVVGVAAVEAGLQAAISSAHLLRVQIPLSEPELALRLTARKDHMREAFDLSAQGLIGGLPDAGSAITGTARDGKEGVGLRPCALVEDLTKLPEIDLVLVRSIGERGAIVSDRRVYLFAKA